MPGVPAAGEHNLNIILRPESRGHVLWAGHAFLLDQPHNHHKIKDIEK